MVDPARLTADTLRVLPRKRMSRALGRIADLRAPSAMLDRAIDVFVRVYDIDLSDYEIPPGGFRSFDEFFTRTLRPGVRPIDPDPATLVSPADGRVEDLGAIDPAATLLVKGKRYEVTDLLDEPEAAERYRGGSFFIVYLSPRDYHRVHAPVAGPVTRARYVGGTLWPVNRIGLTYVPNLFAINERVAIVQNHPELGEVTTVMVGATSVGRISLAFDHEVWTNLGNAPGVRRYGDDGPPIDKGEELGTFHLGSTAIVFVPPGSLRFRVGAGAVVRMGEAVLSSSEVA